MGKDLPVTSGVQLWHNIIPHMEQIVMEDVSTSSIAWKTAKNNAATVSLKTTWKPTFEWKQDLLNVKAVPQQDVFVRDASVQFNPYLPLLFHWNLLNSLASLQKIRMKSIIKGLI